MSECLRCRDWGKYEMHKEHVMTTILPVCGPCLDGDHKQCTYTVVQDGKVLSCSCQQVGHR